MVFGQINLAAESRLSGERERPRQLDQSGGCSPGLGLSSGVEERRDETRSCFTRTC